MLTKRSYALPDSETVYTKFVKSAKLSPSSVTLPDGTTKAYWIGASDAENLIIFFHGKKMAFHIA